MSASVTNTFTNVGNPAIDAAQVNKNFQDLVDYLNNISTPAGALMPFAGSAAPSGWLLCDGSAVSRTTFAALFAAIGTTYGTGDGSTTFNVPDLRGRSPMGAGTGAGGGASGSGKPTGGNALTARSRGDWAGEETHTLSLAETPAHSHAVNNRQDSGTGPSGSGDLANRIFAIGAAGNITTDSKGGGGAHNTVGPMQVVQYLIKT